MKYLFALLLSGLLLPQLALADLIPKDTHTLTNCVALGNAADFSDYQFYLVGENRGWPVSMPLTAEIDCSVVINSAPELIAVKVSDVPKLILADAVEWSPEPPCPECSEGAFAWWETEANADYVLFSDLELPAFDHYIFDVYDAVKMTQIFEIESTENDFISAKLAKVITEDAYGNARIEDGTDGPAYALPIAPATQAESPLFFDGWVAIIMSGVGLMLLLILWRSWSSKNT